MHNPIKWCWRIINIIVHRYLICMVAGFVLSHKFVFDNPAQLLEWRLYCALAALFAIAVFIGKNGAAYSGAVCVGFLIDVAYYGHVHSFQYIENACLPSNYRLIWLSLFIFPVLFLYNCWLAIDEKRKKRQESRWTLFLERQDVFEYIESYLEEHSVLGIDSPYGNGKSTMVEALKQEKKDWAFVTIGILSTTVENIEFCIIREIDRVLESYGVFSNPLSKIKSIFSHDFVYCVGDLLFENQSYERQIENFVKDIRDLGKVIVLNFEDIDRIKDVSHLNKIFSICDSLLKHESKFSTKYIKVIYQYNKKTLNDLFEGEYNDAHYTEKYIPHSVSMPKNASTMFNDVMDMNVAKCESILSKKFDFLNKSLTLTDSGEILYLHIENLTIRVIEQILDLINVKYRDFKKNEFGTIVDVGDEVAFEIITVLSVTRILFPRINEMLESNVNIENLPLFFRDSSRKNVVSFNSLREIAHYREVDEGFDCTIVALDDSLKPFFDYTENINAKHNRDALLVMFLFGYRFDVGIQPIREKCLRKVLCML